MKEKTEGQGLLKKLFGKKSSCCSFEVEEIQEDTNNEAQKGAGT